VVAHDARAFSSWRCQGAGVRSTELLRIGWLLARHLHCLGAGKTQVEVAARDMWLGYVMPRAIERPWARATELSTSRRRSPPSKAAHAAVAYIGHLGRDTLSPGRLFNRAVPRASPCRRHRAAARAGFE
jgi:hypothetical protein